MNDKELSKYFWICKEIEILEKEIEHASSQKDEYISGGDLEMKETLEGYINKIKSKKKQAEAERLHIEEFMDTVTDPEMRVIIRLRYVQMMTWEQIGEEIYMSSSGAFRKCKRYFA